MHKIHRFCVFSTRDVTCAPPNFENTLKDQDLTSKILDVDQWNKLSTTDIDQDFIDDFNMVINDKTLPEMDDVTN